jgi:uncharacterized protein YndB with AHSA1/START domain
MAVKKDALDRRWVEMELIVPGTPEQVWRAIATGPGISAWFVETELEERVGGKLTFNFGSMGSSNGTVTGWEPPRRFAYEERGWNGDAPPVATEVAVTARSGGKCLVRMVHSLFASSDAWDDQLEGFEAGWPGFFAVLQTYLTHFPGKTAAVLRIAGSAPQGQLELWSRLTSALGLAGANVGERYEAPAGAPGIAGLVERVQQDAKTREILLKLDQPGPGIAVVGTFAFEGKAQGMLSFYLYGERAQELAERQREPWTKWFEALVPKA